MTTAPPNADPAAQAQPPVQEPPANTPPAPPAAPPAEDASTLPAWASAKITALNAEAANWRTQLRETQDALKTAKTVEEFTAATQAQADRIAALELDLARGNVARKYELDDDTMKGLEKLDAVALEAAAKAIAKARPATVPANLSGGLDPNGGAEYPTDPAELARKFGGRR